MYADSFPESEVTKLTEAVSGWEATSMISSLVTLNDTLAIAVSSNLWFFPCDGEIYIHEIIVHSIKYTSELLIHFYFI